MKKLVLPAAFFLILLAGLAGARTIKTGDVLDISAGRNPALSRQVVVKEDGTIDYPLLLDKSVADMSVQDLMDLLTYQMAKIDTGAMVVVNLLSDYKVRVNVLGQVKKPGMSIVNKGASVQEVLLMAEGWTEFANLKNIRLTRAGESPDNALSVNLEQFMAEGDLSLLPEVKNGDTYVVMSVKQSKSIKILGAVGRPGFYNAYPDANLFDMIQLAGGQLENADLTKVRHVTTVDGKRVDTVVDLREFWEELKDTDNIPKVQEGDMIIVYKKTITWPLFMQYIRDAVSLFTVYLLVQAYSSGK